MSPDDVPENLWLQVSKIFLFSSFFPAMETPVGESIYCHDGAARLSKAIQLDTCQFVAGLIRSVALGDGR
jgi:hypothetical protein